jgi:hypothetical protein
MSLIFPDIIFISVLKKSILRCHWRFAILPKSVVACVPNTPDMRGLKPDALQRL